VNILFKSWNSERTLWKQSAGFISKNTNLSSSKRY
jgi:hypothetical protein